MAFTKHDPLLLRFVMLHAAIAGLPMLICGFRVSLSQFGSSTLDRNDSSLEVLSRMRSAHGLCGQGHGTFHSHLYQGRCGFPRRLIPKSHPINEEKCGEWSKKSGKDCMTHVSFQKFIEGTEKQFDKLEDQVAHGDYSCEIISWRQGSGVSANDTHKSSGWMHRIFEAYLVYSIGRGKNPNLISCFDARSLFDPAKYTTEDPEKYTTEEEPLLPGIKYIVSHCRKKDGEKIKVFEADRSNFEVELEEALKKLSSAGLELRSNPKPVDTYVFHSPFEEEELNRIRQLTDAAFPLTATWTPHPKVGIILEDVSYTGQEFENTLQRVTGNCGKFSHKIVAMTAYMSKGAAERSRGMESDYTSLRNKLWIAYPDQEFDNDDGGKKSNIYFDHKMADRPSLGKNLDMARGEWDGMTEADEPIPYIDGCEKILKCASMHEDLEPETKEKKCGKLLQCPFAPYKVPSELFEAFRDCKCTQLFDGLQLDNITLLEELKPGLE